MDNIPTQQIRSDVSDILEDSTRNWEAAERIVIYIHENHPELTIKRLSEEYSENIYSVMGIEFLHSDIIEDIVDSIIDILPLENETTNLENKIERKLRKSLSSPFLITRDYLFSDQGLFYDYNKTDSKIGKTDYINRLSEEDRPTTEEIEREVLHFLEDAVEQYISSEFRVVE